LVSLVWLIYIGGQLGLAVIEKWNAQRNLNPETPPEYQTGRDPRMLRTS
jgi:hypothetical protein